MSVGAEIVTGLLLFWIGVFVGWKIRDAGARMEQKMHEEGLL